MMRKTHEKAGICTIALAPEFHQWKSGAHFDDKALYVGTGVTFQDPKRVISSHFMVCSQRLVERPAKNPRQWLTARRLCGGFCRLGLSTESVDKSGDNLRRKAQTTGKMVA